MASFMGENIGSGSYLFCFQDYGKNGHFCCPLGSIWAFWDLKNIITPITFIEVELPHLCSCRAWFQGRIFFCFQGNGENRHFSCPLGSSWVFWDLYKIKPQITFMEVECRTYGVAVFLKVFFCFVSKIMAKNAILVAYLAQFGNFGI